MEPSRRVGGLVGLLVGDALGVPYEFHDPADLPPPERIEMEPPPGFRRAHAGTPPGCWSDDGAHALALLDTLSTRGGWDAPDFGARLVRWWRQGAYAVDGRVYDIGNQTRAALQRLERGVPAERAGPDGAQDNGNGSLMRVLPLALWCEGSDEELYALSRRQSLVTHGHPRAQLCCAVYTAWARAVAAGRGDAFDHAFEVVGRSCPAEDRAELEQIRAFSAVRGTGYVVDTLHVARVALQEPTYERVVRKAIAFGHDTDTSAAVAGGLAGVRDGIEGIPERWRNALRGQELLGPWLRALGDG